MSHTKPIKRGKSLYLDRYNTAAKKYINICSICQRQGYSPVILDDKFYDRTLSPFISCEKRAIYEELTKILKPLLLDNLGRCDVCSRILST